MNVKVNIRAEGFDLSRESWGDIVYKNEINIGCAAKQGFFR
jgi:hypothetical protein